MERQAPPHLERKSHSMSTAIQPRDALRATQSLSNKQAVIFGAAGAVGSAVAREFAAQGASVYLSGRHLEGVQQVAAEIQVSTDEVQSAEVDALNESEVNAYLADVIRQAGRIDIAVNLMGQRPSEYSNGTPSLELPLEHFTLPLTKLVPSQFITARAAARHMVKQRAGVILFVTAVPSRSGANVSAIGAAFGAIESLARGMAGELGPSGVRVVGIRSGAMIDTRTIQQSLETTARRLSIPLEQVVARLEETTLLKRLPTAADTARLAAFLASDAAQAITGAIVNASSGSIVD
jgi:NAD(P)-dependent dehydrogenase (short-subunit alcohol dehydrogenase family)